VLAYLHWYLNEWTTRDKPLKDYTSEKQLELIQPCLAHKHACVSSYMHRPLEQAESIASFVAYRTYRGEFMGK